GEFSPAELDRAHNWCVRQVTAALTDYEERQEARDEEGRGARRASADDDEREERSVWRRTRACLESEGVALPRPGEDEAGARELGSDEGVDGRTLEEAPTLDREDDALLLRIWQRTRGPLRRGQNAKEALV